MKHQRRYHLLRQGVEIVLPRLRFKEVAWHARLGHWLLGQLNRIGAKWTYEAVYARGKREIGWATKKEVKH